MTNQMTDQLDYSKYFPQFNNALLVGFLILGVFLIGLTAFILIRQRKLTKRTKIILLSISVIYGGFILGGFPNVIFLTGLTFLILGVSLIFSRIFCGYICPLGAAQELSSMVRFKTSLDYDRKLKKNKILPYVRWIFFGAFIIIILIWGFEITLFMNPMNGFLFPWYPTNLLFLIVFILLIGTIAISFFVYRPFCRYVCPFGTLASLVARVSPLKIRRTGACLDCTLCEKICPTLVGFRNSNKGECYLCNRCIDFCSNEMFIDIQKISQINKLLTALTLNFNELPKEKFFDKIIKNIIRLFIPKKRMRNFDEFIDALECKRDFYLETIQNIVVKLRNIFPDEIKKIDRTKYKRWIEQNESQWKEKIDSYHLDKLFYGIAKEA